MSMNEDKQQKLDLFNGFTGLKEKTIYPIFKWDESEEFVMNFEHKISDYKISTLEGCYGTSHFIDIQIYDFDSKTFSIQKLKIDSVRLRIALKRFSDKQKNFPITVKVKRIGEKFATQYTIEPYEIQ